MKNSFIPVAASYHVFIGLLVTLNLGLASGMALADEALPSTEQVKVLLDTETVRVSEVVRPPGTVVPMHTHPPYLVYFLSNWEGRHFKPDGTSKEKVHKAGTYKWAPKGATHSVEVLGTNDLHVLLIELKK